MRIYKVRYYLNALSNETLSILAESFEEAYEKAMKQLKQEKKEVKFPNQCEIRRIEFEDYVVEP